MSRTGRALALAGLLSLLSGAAGAELTTLTIDHVSVEPGGRHRVWVSVLDESGRPLTGQEASQFSLEEDQVRITEFGLIPYARRYPRVVVTVIADPEILTGASPSSVVPLLRALRGALSNQDRLRVVSAGGRFPSTEIPEDAAQSDIESRLGPLAAVAPSSIQDAAARDVRRARDARDGQVILLVTRGGLGTAKSKILDTVAMLRDRDRPATISLLQVGDGPSGNLRDRLMRLVDRSGGDTKSARTPQGMAEAGTALVDRARGAYLLDYRFSEWEPAVEAHTLRVGFRRQDVRYYQELEFSAGDVATAPWWALGRLWAVGGLLVIGGAGLGWLAVRPRPRCRLLVEGGEERGYTYEILDPPIRIGAIEGNDLILDDPQISRNHALLVGRRGGFDLLDLNSENGTYVNGVRIVRQSLSKGDRIEIGAVVFRFLGPR